MTERVNAWLLRVLKVPAAPAPPPGDPRVVRTFRAAPSYFRYSVLLWLLKQASALTGLLVSYFFFRDFVFGGFIFGWFGLVEQLAIAAFVAQLPFSYAVLRLDFDMRWYMLSDRSLRIRAGVLSVREQTMTFANIQNIAIRQNPLQRIFGISTVVVRAAGGGSSSAQSGGKQSGGSSHQATFEGVDDPELIRTAIRERIRMHRDAGLGDPDEVATAPDETPPPAPPATPGSLLPALDAVRRVLGEAAALRTTVAASAAPVSPAE